MAVKNCEELSNIISLGIVSWDEDLANEIARLSTKKRDALARAWKLWKDEDIDALTWRSAHELELKANSADIEMRAIVQAKILNNEVRVADAYRELAEQIRKEWWTISRWVDLLEKLRKASPADLEDIAKQWWWEYSSDPVKVLEEMKQAISENISANYSIRQYSEVKGKWLEKLRKQLRDWEITKEAFDDEVKKLHQEAMDQIAKWENPKDFAKLDEEWATIKKIFWDDPLSAKKAWSQFIMARELLSDWAIDDWVLKAFADMWAENLTGPLDLDQIAKYWKDDLDKLLARAYTNTEQLYRDWILRETYRDKLVELTSWMRVSQENMQKAKSIINTMEFAEKGATFSDVITADNAARSAAKRGIKVKDGSQLLHWIKAFAKKLWEDPTILKDPIKIAWVEFKPIDLIQIIYDITQDENILKLLKVGFFNDGTVLSVATSRLLGWNKEAAERILKLFSKAKEAAKVTSIRDVSLKAICWDEIKEWAPMGFFDFRKPLYQKDELNRAKADFYDKLAEKNKMKVDSTDISVIPDSEDVNVLTEELKKYKWGYIIVNDSQWRANSVFSDAFDQVNKDLKDEEKITALFPRGWLSSNFTMEDGQLFYKTLYDDVYRDVAGTISIQTLWEARPTREILATAFEAATGKNGDKIRYQPSYTNNAVDNQWRQISDQQYEYFSNSKARDENGNLLTFYHWTNAKFDVFDINAARRSSDIQWMFFSEWYDEAKGYWENIWEYYLNIVNPASADVAYRVWDKFKWQTNAWVFAREELQRMGYDWVQSFQWEWIVFSPDQIKYVDNRLPTTDPRMRYQERMWRESIPQSEISVIDAWNARVKASKELWDFSWAQDYKLIEDYYNNMKNFLSQFEPSELEILKKYSKVYKNVSDVEGWAKKNWIAVENLIAFTDNIPLDIIHNTKIFDDISLAKYYELVWDWAKIAKSIDDVSLYGWFTGVSDLKFQLVWPEWLKRLIKDYPDYVNRYNEAVKMLEAWVSSDEIYANTGLSVSAWWDIEFEIPWTNKFTSKFNDAMSYKDKITGYNSADKIQRKVKKDIKTVWDIIDNPELFAAYPELKNRPVHIKKMSNWGWYYSPWKDDFTFALYEFLNNDEARWRDIVSHELQHYIQHHEWHDFWVHNKKISKAKEWDAVRLLYQNIKGLKDVNIPDWVKSSNARYPKLMIVHEYYKELLDSLSDDIKKIRDKELAAYAKIEKDWEEWRKKLFAQMDKSDFDAYYREAWESQSYAVWYRERNWDATRGTSPSWQEPFPREMQLMKDSFWNEITWYHYIPAELEGEFTQRYMRAIDAGDNELVKNVLDEYAMVKHFEPLKWPIDYSELPYEIAENFRKQFRTVIWNDKPINIDEVPFQNPSKKISQTTQSASPLALPYYVNEANISATDAMKVEMFTKNRTWKEIADEYWFDVKIVEWNMIEWVAAYWAYWNWVIYFSQMVKDNTAPHELFHAIFDIVWKEEHDKILADATKLFGYSADEAEEILADSFAEWFKTWKFKYWEVSKKGQKTFFKRVEQFFKDIADWLWLVDNHRAEVEQMFNDMVNMKYLPDAWKSVDATQAMIKYNDELNASAANYFGRVLWEETPDVISKEYVDRVQNMLSERLWIDMKAFDQIQNKSALWQKVDEKFTLERFTTWRYDREVVDINSVKNQIASLTDEQLETEIKKDLWNALIRWTIRWNDNIAHIREAYLDYKTAPTAMDSLMSKWKIISLANGWTAQTMSMQQIRDMFTNWTFEKTYKEMFLSNQTLTDKEMKQFIDAINSNIFDTLSIQFAENLVDAGYSLPLMNIRSFVYEYLRWTIDLNNKFVEAFLYKNKIPYTADWLKSIVDTLMPTEFKFDYEDALFKWRFGKMEQWNISTVKEIKNRFLPESYSAIAAVEMAEWADIGLNYERDILNWILDKYTNEVLDWVKNWTLDFQWAQWLKQEAGYALDMFEQDYLLPRYGRFLSKQERQWITNLKSLLPIGVKWQNVDKLREELVSIRNKINQRYSMTLSNAAKNNDINMSILKWVKGENDKMQKIIDERRQQLMDSGWIIKEVNWQYLVYDVKQALADTIAQLPQNIWWLEWIKALWRAWIEWLSNKQAYAMLRYLEAAKGLNSTANLATDLLYKQNPRLQQYNFFQSYKIGKEWIPIALEWNLLNMDKYLSKFDNISAIDTIAKKNVFEKIVSKFREQSYLTVKDLDKIIDKSIAESQVAFKQVKMSPKETKEAIDRMKLVYKKVFEPYVHVKDIPKWWTLLDGKTTVRNIKQKVADAMKQQYNQAINDLKVAWIDDINNLQTAIYITTNDWRKISLQEAWEMNIDSWKKDIFNDESIFVAWADDLKKFEGSPDDEALVKRQKERRNDIISQYDSNLRAMLNQTQYITEAESKLMTAFMNDVRTSMRQYTLTNQIVDALDSLSWLNEEAARWIKDYLIWWKWNISFWKWTSWQILKRNELVQEAYSKYYAMDLSKLRSVKPETKAEDLALRLAKYFKNLERLLGSADWLTWCTTSAQLNRAFFHIWEVVENINTVKWVFWLLSWVEQNQVLKFFKFAKWQLADDAAIFIRRGKWNFTESLWWYRDYAENISGITRDEFNEIFAANFSEWDFKRILQWLTWFSLTWDWWWRTKMKILNALNWSNFIFRFLMSYPWQLLTIPQQTLAYFLKQIWFERELWVESMSDVDAVRAHFWVLDWAYNEIVLRWKSTVSPDDLRLDSYYNRYWIPDVDEIYKTSTIETSDDYINMYAKIDNHAASSISATNKWFRQLDPYKDNANNIIDGLFARNFKNISFLKAIRWNDFLQFSSAKEFLSFMEDPKVSAEVKTRLMDRVSAYSGRNFRNILWLGFWGIDRAVAWSWFWNIMYWLIQLFNFRWSWWQNIFKQTWANLWTALKMLATSKWARSREWREALAEYIAKQPEFTNFIWALFSDLRWTWKLQRFQDNWRWPDDENFYDGMDFIEYMTDTLNMTSQRFQGLQSFWPLRPFEEQARSIFASHMNPTIYKDIAWVWAFFNALWKNFWRQRKPVNWIAKWAAAFTTWGPEEALNYLQSEFWKLSFWSLRYMVNEDQNAYWYTYEMSWQTWGIPNILMWENKLNSDKNFTYEIDNTETWETIGQIFNWDIPWDARRTYIWNLGKAFMNWSQLVSIWNNLYKAIARKAPSYSSNNELANTIQKTDAGKEFYRKWIVTPKTAQEAEIFFNTMLNNAKYRPWSSNFTKSLIQYDDYWHMDWKNWKKADAEMELWLDHMKYLTNSHWEFSLQWWEKVVDPSWNKLIQDVKNHWYNESYTTNLIYNYAKNWLNNHSSDPNYQLYVKMLWQWQAHNLIEYYTSEVIDALNVWKKWKDNKWTKTEFEDVWLDTALLLRIWNSKIQWEDMILFDKLQVLDEDDATVAALQIIQSQAEEWDRKILDRFFDVEENDDGSKSVSLKRQYESTLKQIWTISKAIDAGNVDLAIAEASTLVNMYKSKDPTWAVTASLIDSIYNRVYDTDSFTPSQKQEVMAAVFHKNKEFIQRNPERLRELLWDDYDLYADYMNSMLYQWDGMTISNLESMQSSWTGSKSWAKSANSLSSAFKQLANEIWWDWGSNGRWTWSMWSYKEWVPVTIQWANLVKELWLKWYTPQVDNLKVQSYKPHIDLSTAKDINRNVKWPKTETISTKKQLSNIESKTIKALEAED